MNRIQLQPAFILHRRPFSDSSLLLDLFTLEYGRMSAIAKGARAFKSRFRGKLELFSHLLISCSGRSELKIITNVESESAPFILPDERLLCGFYLNELLMRLLPRFDPYHHLFDYYQKALINLNNGIETQIILRCFEKYLLHELGYGLTLHETENKEALQEEQFYEYFPNRGFVKSNNKNTILFSGRALLALHFEKNFEGIVLLELKKLMRLILHYYLGEKPLKSRELF